MFDCLIVGDSIAVGTKQFMPECQLQGKGGINTWQFNKMYPGSFYADTVIISLGSNDHKGVKTYDELFEMRQRVGASNVFWVLPHGVAKGSGVSIEKIQSIVKEIAEYYEHFRVTSDLLELRNLVIVAELIIRSAQHRKESRGLHYTLDYPETDNSKPAENTILIP